MDESWKMSRHRRGEGMQIDICKCYVVVYVTSVLITQSSIISFCFF